MQCQDITSFGFGLIDIVDEEEMTRLLTTGSNVSIVTFEPSVVVVGLQDKSCAVMDNDTTPCLSASITIMLAV